jgi:hypothetical protein
VRNSDCYRLAKLLLPHLPGFATNKKSEIFMAPVDNVWRGFTFESTPNSREEFYFWWFSMPICRPIEYLTLSPGGRLEVPSERLYWRTDMADLPEKLLEALNPVALPLLQSINTIQDTIELICAQEDLLDITDINSQDEIACLQILDGRFNEAAVMLDKIIAHENGPYKYQWILNIVERMKGLRSELHEDPQLAVDQVKAWQDYTFKALKLEKWR